MNLPARINIIGSRISACNAESALELLDARANEGRGGYVCFTNVHAAVTGRRHPDFQAITNGSFLSFADGKPLYWVGKLKRGGTIGHVPGPDFMMQALRRFANRRHFLYGSTPAVLAQLVKELESNVSGLSICGTLSPPFRPLSDAERHEHYRIIRDSGAEFTWVGLGAPKQEQWMAQASEHVAPSILLGVGAAFDFHAGTLRRAPEGLRNLGLEWLYRLLQEPRRLGRRYLVTNTLFVWYALQDAVGTAGR